MRLAEVSSQAHFEFALVQFFPPGHTRALRHAGACQIIWQSSMPQLFEYSQIIEKLYNMMAIPS